MSRIVWAAGNDGDTFAIIPTLEFVGWSVQNGQQSTPDLPSGTELVDGIGICNLYPGARFVFDSDSSVSYAGVFIDDLKLTLQLGALTRNHEIITRVGGADDLVGGIAGQFFAGPVPVSYLAGCVDHEGGDGIGLQDLAQIPGIVYR